MKIHSKHTTVGHHRPDQRNAKRHLAFCWWADSGLSLILGGLTLYLLERVPCRMTVHRVQLLKC